MGKVVRMLSLSGLSVVLMQGCDTAVSYSKDVRPILEDKCIECHSKARQGEGFQKSGFNMDTYDSLMKGTKFGAVVKPGDSFTSAIVMLVEGRADPSIKMPHQKADTRIEDLTASEIETLKKWIDQGAPNN